MSTGRSPLLITIFALISTAMSNADEVGLRNAARNNPLKLDGDVAYEADGTSRSLTVNFVNKSPLAACVSAAAFNAINESLSIWNGKNQRVLLSPLGYPDLKVLHGFSYEVPYYILLPGLTLDVSRSLSQFRLEKGVHRYSFHIPYYICKDVVDSHFTAKAKSVHEYWITLTGKFEIR